MAIKDRYQNPTPNDQLILNLFTYNSNSRSNFNSVQKIDIYYLDPTLVSESNPKGLRLVQTIPSSAITIAETGLYTTTITLTSPLYVIGNYIDVWTVLIEETDPKPSTIQNTFAVYPDLWFTSPVPIVYDFNFSFRPNKIRLGSKRYIIIDVMPNVPKASDLQKYYENLSITSPLTISIAQSCDNCTTDEDLIVDHAPITLREKTSAYYFLDTTNYDAGIYDVWVEMDFAESHYVSDIYQIQIF